MNEHEDEEKAHGSHSVPQTGAHASRRERRGTAGLETGRACLAEVPDRVCLDRHMTMCVYKAVESSFAIIAEPNRRAILSLLASSERSVGEIEQRLRLPQTSVSKHLRVLREAGFVESRVEAQRRVYRIRPEPLMEVDAWLAPFRRFWTAHVDALERHLDRMEQAPRKGKNR
ncbi:MAG: ArsR/SmtB family transcription factor [Myxococcales bacterium]